MKKNLLVISNAYPDKDGKSYSGVFVKERVEYVKDFFDRIVVVSPHSFGKKHMFSYTEDNVYVAFPSFIHFPIESMRKWLGDKFAASTQAVIEHHKISFDIIHAHSIWPSGYAAMLLSKIYKVPYIVTAHGGDLYKFPFEGNWKMEVARKVLLNASHIVVVAEFMKDIILKEIFSEDTGIKGKISIVPNGVDLKKFDIIDRKQAREILGLPLDVPIVLNVGNLVPVKNQEVLIREFGKVLHTFPDAMLYIVGNGHLKKRLERIIILEGLKRNVILVGARPHDEIPFWMNAADVFVLPSKKEGLPVSMLESLSVGTPVVVSNLPGLRGIVNDTNGIVCDDKNLGECIVAALYMRWNRRNIYTPIRSQYTWTNISMTIAEVYNRISFARNSI